MRGILDILYSKDNVDLAFLKSSNRLENRKHEQQSERGAEIPLISRLTTDASRLTTHNSQLTK